MCYEPKLSRMFRTISTQKHACFNQVLMQGNGAFHFVASRQLPANTSG